MSTAPAVEQRYYDSERETMARADLETLQLELLQVMVARAYERAPLYREVWDDAGFHPRDLRSLDDFTTRVPFIDKDTLRRWRDERGDPYGGVLCVDPAELTAIMSTSGTTGDPTLVPERWGGTSHDDRIRPAVMYRDFWEIGVRPGDHALLNLFTFRGPIYGFAHALGAVPIVVDYGEHELSRLCDLSLRYRPTVLYNLGGTLLLALERALEERSVDPVDVFSSYRGVVTAGEPMGPRARALAAEWGIELFEHTSVGDVTASFECREHDGLHFWEDTAFVEAIEPGAPDHRHAAPVADGGRAELVATSLFNSVAPLIRYRSDDLVRLDRSTCRCGRTHARMWPLGRLGDETIVAGYAVLPTDVWHAVETVRGAERGLFQIVRPRREVDVLRLRVGYANVAAGDLARVRDDLVAAVEAAVGVAPDVELVPEAELLRLGPPHKIPRVTKA
jgi:phenylacetate-CoA ligase